MRFIMPLLFLIIILISCSTSNILNNNLFQVDTNKRFNNIINYIERDSIIERKIYKYYPKIECFDFPEYSEPDTLPWYNGIIGVEDYMFIVNDTNRSIKYKYNILNKLDSLNKLKVKDSNQYQTNYIKKEPCSSLYHFEVTFQYDSIWIIYILPKEIRPGIYRSIGYSFVFDKEDRISRVKTGFMEE